MYHAPSFNARFWAFLFTIDQDLAETTRRRGCPCGGRCTDPTIPASLGASDSLPDTYRTDSVSPAIETGAESKSTPPSVRFLGRKIYVGTRRFDQRHAARTIAAAGP